ncbi:EF-hand domain-containing protein [Paracoccus niistensis]|uniref:EF-hand domain-containing protein n=1 Tax=Paracoccus niistensis TaxID=632935 RepID=A0ABV6I002_9RHOB
MKRSLAILVASSFALAAVGANAGQHDQDQSGMMADGSGQPGGMMGRGGMSHAMMLKMMVALADTNNDGALSLEEVQAVHARMFNMADGDGNGQVTMEEIQGFMQGGATAAPQAR